MLLSLFKSECKISSSLLNVQTKVLFFAFHMPFFSTFVPCWICTIIVVVVWRAAGLAFFDVLMSTVSYLQVQSLTRSVGDKTLFADISFSVAQGQKAGLIARNGTGKSTLLNIIHGTNPTIETIQKICGGFDISLGTFFNTDYFYEIYDDEWNGEILQCCILLCVMITLLLLKS